MANTPAARARFDVRFLEKPPDDCCCPICLSVMSDPHLTSCCGQHYCQDCITRILLMGQPCPICKEQEFSTLFDRQLRNRISVLDVYCPMESKGCRWQGKYEELEPHLSVGKMKGECLFILVPCPFDCERSFPRRHLTRHMTRECENRHNQCRVCYRCGGSESDDRHHSDCPNRSVDCPNGCPIPNIRFCDLQEHTNHLCPYRHVECKFHRFGCTATFKFKDGPRHYVENTSNHLECIRQYSVNQSGLEEMCVQLAERNNNLEIAHQQLQHKVFALESKCKRYESTLSELREMVQSLKQSREQPHRGSIASSTDSWEVSSPSTQSSAHYTQLPIAKPRKDKNSFSFRP